MAEPRPSDRQLIRKRIRDGIFRERGGIISFRSEPLPGAVAAAADGDSEAAELERDVGALHDLHVLHVGTETPRHRMLGRLIAPIRRLAEGVLRPMLGHQSAFNGTAARAISSIRNQAIRNERLLHEHAKFLGEHTGTLLDIERAARTLEREIGADSARQLGLDQFALANAFRGTEDSVKERQQRYVERFAGRRKVVDLGCGRGEFLELLREAEIGARGIDSDSRMVEYCRLKRLSVEQRDALEYLSGLPDESEQGFFAAQVIEHLPAFDLVRLVREARRALEPGGVLLVESVNPESLMTFAEFYIDPTHVRPYHPQAVRWLFKEEGFVDVEVELSVDPEPGQPLPPLAAAGIEAPEFDRAVAALNTLVYGSRAYAVAGATPRAQV
jgi:SAM-dependent methyltransferase